MVRLAHYCTGHEGSKQPKLQQLLSRDLQCSSWALSPLTNMHLHDAHI